MAKQPQRQLYEQSVFQRPEHQQPRRPSPVEPDALHPAVVVLIGLAVLAFFFGIALLNGALGEPTERPERPGVASIPTQPAQAQGDPTTAATDTTGGTDAVHGR